MYAGMYVVIPHPPQVAPPIWSTKYEWATKFQFLWAQMAMPKP